MSATTWSTSRSDARSRRSTVRATSAPSVWWPGKPAPRPSARGTDGLRLGDVVQQRGEAHPVAAAQALGERLGEQRPQRVGVPGQPGRGRIGGDEHRGVEDLERVAEDVAVVVDALLDARAAPRARAGSRR